jgi:hypothetical protein
MRRIALLKIGIALLASFFATAAAQAQQDLGGNELPESVAQLIDDYRYADALAPLRRLSNSGNQAATFLLANYHVCGKHVPFSCSEAEHHFGLALIARNRSRLDPEISRRARNEIAWLHAACEQKGFSRNLELALRYAVDAAADGKDPYALDTLAAVQARSGKFEAAVEMQKRAFDALVRMRSDPPVPAYTKTEFSARIALYKRHLPAKLDESNYRQNCNTLPDKQ